METISKLNEKELQVLIACKQAIVLCTGCEFGYGEDVTVTGLSKNQIKGYLSQLSQKKFITIREDFYGQIHFTKNGVDYLLSQTTMESDIEQLNDIRDNI